MTQTELESTQNGEHEASVERTGEQIVSKSLDDISVVEKSIQDRLGVEPGAELVKLTDEALVDIAEHELTSPDATIEDRQDAIEDVVIESAVELAHGATPDQTALSIFSVTKHPGEISDVVDRLEKSHATLPSGHEAAPLVEAAIAALDEHPVMEEPGTVQFVSATEMSERKTERRFDSDDTLSEGAYKLVEDLRMQREREGRGVAKAKQDGYIGRPIYSEFESLEFLGGAEITAADSMAILRELHAVAEHVANVESAGWDAGRRKDIFGDMVDKSSLIALNSLKADMIPVLLKDKGQDGQFFRILHEQARSALVDYPYDGKTTLEAHLDGFASVKDKYDAMQNGEYPRNEAFMEVAYIDILFEGKSSELEANEAAGLSMDYFSRHLGLPEEFSSEIYLSIQNSSTFDGKQLGYSDNLFINGRLLKAQFARISERVTAIGPENIAKLRQEQGIVNIADLSLPQLDRMVKFMDGDPDLEQELASREVCVVIRDATADWNGAFRGMYSKYEPEDGVMLAFEVSSMADSGRQMQSITKLLADRGVQPSVLILAGHGSPGSVHFGDGLLLGREPQHYKGEYGTLETSGIADLMGSMRPDRDGNSHVVYESCSSGGTINGEAVDVLRADDPLLSPLESTDDIEAITEGLAGRPTPESTLVLAAKAARSRNPDNTYQFSGVDTPASFSKSIEGRFRFPSSGGVAASTRIIMPAGSETTYRMYDKDIVIPMFLKSEETLKREQEARAKDGGMIL